MKISVCIATYNGEKYIKEQLDSILYQIGEDSEVIISDDGSTDKTLDIIREYSDDRIKIFINQGRKGYTKNFENALKHSTGDYIFLSDQDDVWLPNKVDIILKNIQENQLILTDAWICDDNLNSIKKLSEWRRYKSGYIDNLYKGVYVGCTMAFNRNMLSFFLPIPNNIIGHDVWFGLLAELKYSIRYIDVPLIYYRRHNQTFSTSGTKSKNSLWFMIKYRLYVLYYTLKRYIFNHYA
ncbi:MAG: glycosyltransferase family 2 protein [Chitinophagaceae bacterium]